MIISDNLIISDSFKKIRKHLEEFKNIIQSNEVDPLYEEIYNDFFEDYRFLLGKQIWLSSGDFEFEKELIFEILDLDLDLEKTLTKIKTK